MGLMINSASQKLWLPGRESRTFGAGNPITDSIVWSTNANVVRPPDNEIWLVRSLVFWVDDADQLVGAGGATDLQVRDQSLSFIQQTLAVWNSSAVGWPDRQASSQYSFGGGLSVLGQNMINKVNTRRPILFTTLPGGGSITGTIHWSYEYKITDSNR